MTQIPTVPTATTPDLRARVRGCLLGGALGDALGAPVEFKRLDRIRAEYGERGITRPDPQGGRHAVITDDTQMTLFTAEGLVRTWVRGRLGHLTHTPAIVHDAYLRWLATQGRRPHDRSVAFAADGWLFAVPGLHALRGPGVTCLTSLEGTRRLGSFVQNDRKGCGGVMRVAPVGFWPYDDAFALGAETAHLTHGHPSGYLAAGHLAEVLRALVEGEPLRAAIQRANERLADEPRGDEVRRAVDAAVELADRGPAPDFLPRSMGEGWVAEEALAIGLYCALVAHNSTDALRLAVNHDGDSDSTGCIAGQILGAMSGPSVLPDAWLETLELRAEIERMAADLASVCDSSHPPEPQTLADAYPVPFD